MPNSDQKMRLIAKGQDDLAVISSLCQDALLAVRDFTYDPEKQNLVCILNRFCWERLSHLDSTDDVQYYRTHTALEFHHVSGVAYAGFDKNNLDLILNLLSIKLVEQAGVKYILFKFSDNKAVRITVISEDIRMMDVGIAWPTNLKPAHQK